MSYDWGVAMKKRPILLSGEMVRAILDGRKTQTRRVVKPNKRYRYELDERGLFYENTYGDWDQSPCPYGQPGDQLWVRETWADLRAAGGFDDPTAYRASTSPDGDEIRKQYGIKWKPSIHMPRWASRIQLEITGIRVERLAAITEADSWHEGFPDPDGQNKNYPDRARYWFKCLWDSLHAKAQYEPTGYEWASNPWVWVVEFKRLREKLEKKA